MRKRPPLWKGVVNQIERAIGETARRQEEREKRAAEQQIAANADNIKRFESAFEAYEKQQASREDAKQRRDDKTITALWAAAFFTFILAALSFCQLREARIIAGTQHADTQEAIQKAQDANGLAKMTAERQAGDTQIALTLTKQAAEAATRSAIVAETGVRAWVAPVTFAFRDLSDPNDPLIVRVAYQNVGRQPARNVRNWSTLDHIFVPNIPPAQWGDLQEWQDVTRFSPREMCNHVVGDKTSVLYPTSIPTLALEVGGSEKFPNMGTFDYWALVGEIKDRQTVLIAKGCFTYETLGETRHSAFCIFLAPIPGKDIGGWSFNMCPAGNDDY